MTSQLSPASVVLARGLTFFLLGGTAVRGAFLRALGRLPVSFYELVLIQFTATFLRLPNTLYFVPLSFGTLCCSILLPQWRAEGAEIF